MSGNRKDNPNIVFWILAAILVGTLVLIGMALTGNATEAPAPFLPARLTPHPPELHYTIEHTGPLEVAKVFGRSPACQNADADFIQEVSDAAISAGVDPGLLASIVSIESGCSQYAISSRGAVGVAQIMPRIWMADYDLSGRYNLFNVQDNLDVGARIISNLVDRFGVVEGIRRYQGTGTDCATCDPGYTEKILALSGQEETK